MKMENNIASASAGVVSAVHVQNGQEIENNGLLVSISQ
jgi:biotin carboxyl carrier protein